MRWSNRTSSLKRTHQKRIYKTRSGPRADIFLSSIEVLATARATVTRRRQSGGLRTPRREDRKCLLLWSVHLDTTTVPDSVTCLEAGNFLNISLLFISLAGARSSIPSGLINPYRLAPTGPPTLKPTLLERVLPGTAAVSLATVLLEATLMCPCEHHFCRAGYLHFGCSFP